jgi:hypothetical protein
MNRLFAGAVSTASTLLLAGLFVGPTAHGQVPFDFSDGFYVRNGLDPQLFDSRISPSSPNAAQGPSPDAFHNSTRIMEANGGFDAAGQLLYYPAPPANFSAQAFTPNAAGDHARDLANQFRAFIFPRADGDPLSPAPPNRRHDNIFDTSSGYETANPLGLWRVTFPAYTLAAFNTQAGMDKLEEIRDRNGTDLDGTPVIKRLSEIQELESMGLLVLNQRNEDGSQGFPWVV